MISVNIFKYDSANTSEYPQSLNNVLFKWERSKTLIFVVFRRLLDFEQNGNQASYVKYASKPFGKYTMYQRKVDVDKLNAVKSVLAYSL